MKWTTQTENEKTVERMNRFFSKHFNFRVLFVLMALASLALTLAAGGKWMGH